MDRKTWGVAIARVVIVAAALGSVGAQAADEAPPKMVITHPGDTPSARGLNPTNFTGAVRVDLLHAAEAPWHASEAPWHASAAYVTFEPGARSVWHTHPAGQLLIVTAGAGRVQQDGGPVVTLHPGDVVWTPPGVKHWHGAGETTGMTHLAITESLDGKNVDWLEPVVDVPVPEKEPR